MSASKKVALALALALLALAVLAPAASADFGIRGFSAIATNEDGTIDNRAGSHPYEYTVKFSVNQREDALHIPEGRLRTVVVDLPAGMVGDPTAVPTCARADFDGFAPRCPPAAEIGTTKVSFVNNGNEDLVAESPVYNLTSPLGSPATIGFNLANVDTFLEGGVRSGADYGISLTDFAIPADLEFQEVTMHTWGVPMDPAHTPERTCQGRFKGCSSEAPLAPFLTLPTSCTGPLATTLHLESLENPGVFSSKTILSENENGQSEGMVGCEALPFAPTISARPQSQVADSATGLDVDVHVPQAEGCHLGPPVGCALASAHLKDAHVTLPSGLAVNPSAAPGLGACSLAQIDLHGSGPATCPDDSKLGTVEVSTPLLDHPLSGSVYLARQLENPFDSLLALYIAIEDPLTGVVVKIPGRVEPNLTTGQLTANFEDNPQLPFEDFKLSFFGGRRASLTTPATCGTYTTTADLTPWSSPEGGDAFSADSFPIVAAAGGGPCPASETQMPNKPTFEAGTTSPLAGTYSPFVLRLSRESGSQRFGALNLTLPEGLTARFAGRAECSDAQIAQAQGRSNPGEGAREQRSPSCPAGSELGTVTVGAGSGSPLYVQGHAYLAGPYKGAPFSIVAITPAVAGPFDLGVVVVRSALYVNEETAQGTVKTDPIPTILQGIPLQVRSIAIGIDNGDFTLNPTSCEASSVGGEMVSTSGSVAQLQNRFQVGGCRGLEFHPQIKLQMTGATKRTGHPKLKAVVSFPHKVEEANAKSIQVGLPRAFFLDQGNLNKVCTRPQLASRSCPASSVYGRVKAWTPLFEEPLTGPVYLGVGFGYKLPALVTELNGRVRILAHGRVDTTKQKGLRNTFEFIPDAPISRIVLQMKGGKKYGLLENSESLCGRAQYANARFVAHNGVVAQLHPRIATSCDQSRGRARHTKHRRATR